MYRYARTRNRVHRVVVEGGRAFKVENCNLDDVGFLRLEDQVPEGQKCAHCWAGWVEPPPSSVAEEDVAARDETPIPEGAKAIPLVTSTRRLALVALAGAALLGGGAGVLLSPDPSRAIEGVSASDLDDRIDDLLIEIRLLGNDIDGHTHETIQGPPVVVVVPSQEAHQETAAPSVLPGPSPVPTPAPSEALGGPSTSEEILRTRIVREVVVVVPGEVQTAPPARTPPPDPTAAPTPAPTPCFRPGLARGGQDPCRWPPDD